MSDSNVALVDMDGTLCDYSGKLQRKLNYLLSQGIGYSVDANAPEWERLVDFVKSQPGFWRSLPRIELGFQIVELLKSAEFDIHILTKGPYRTTGAWTEKVEWCREHLPGVPVTITEGNTKSDAKGKVYGKILVDDWPPYCEGWLKWRPRGLVIMPAYDYNEGFDDKFPGRVIRASECNLNEIEDAIQKVAKRQPGQPL